MIPVEPHKQGRPILGRLFFAGSMILLAAGLFRAAGAGTAVWSRAARQGGIQAIAPLAGGFAAAQLYGDRLVLLTPERRRVLDYPKPIQLLPTPGGGALVLSMLSPQINRLLPSGHWGEKTWLPKNYIAAGALAEPHGVWVAGYRLHRADDRPKKHFYFPEYFRFEWFVQWFDADLPPGRIRLGRDLWHYENEEWHEETAGVWRLLATNSYLYVVNDQAESVNCLYRENGRPVWRAATPPRPTGAAIWGDRLLVCSAHAGVLETYRLDNGGRIWSRQFGRGLAGMTMFFDKVVLADNRRDRLLLVDPLDGIVISEVGMRGAPHGLAVDGTTLLVGLDSTNEVVRLDAVLREIERIDLGTGEKQ